ncbi:hypothetical protein LO772_10940 [Yinghuangia sp. ASG 101]|uniref:hypothetical protein n=1 Tax=Yinghuangia sp. ASG 101 TaxID=2896848 RepID=UPI001E443948|nr:hypothetical protein [Yinghuangia sp. ASG 101]UGQ14067.1 hypothetical protein LO772_10940 [Yinghuangia sp. ASG 101]
MFPLRRLRATRSGAVLAGSALVLSGVGLTVLAPAAHAGTVTPTVHCVLPAGQGEGTGPQSMTVDLSPASTTPGSTVHAVVTLGPGATNSTQTMNDIPTTPSIHLAMSGGATGNVTVTGPTTNIDVVAGQPVQLPTFEGDFLIPASANGVVEFTPTGTSTVTRVLGSNFTTPCDVVSGGGVVATVTAQGAGSEQPSLTAPTGVIRPGNAIALSGAGYVASAAAVPALCDASGGSCDTGLFTAHSLTISAAGVLSGSATLARSVADGNYVVQVTAGGKIAQAPVTVEAFVPVGNPVITLDRGRGPVGTEVNVSGNNFPPNTTVRLNGVNAAGGVESGSKNYTTNGSGVLAPSPYTIQTEQTTGIRVRLLDLAGTPQYIVPFTVANDPPTVAVGETTTHRGGTVAVSGVNWTPGTTPTAALCAANGTSCTAASLSASSLAIAADGTLSGTVTIGNSVAYGSYALAVTAGGQTATTPLSVQQRWIQLSPSSGALGTVTTVVGKGYGTLAWIKLYGVDAAGVTTDDYSYAAADIFGNWVTWMAIQDPDTTAIVAAETFAPSKKASARFGITP